MSVSILRRNAALFPVLFLGLAVLPPLARGSGLTAIASFNGTTNGGHPPVGVTVDANGDIFGVASTIWEIKAGSNSITTLGTFSTSNGSDPNSPVLLNGGALYGTTENGGTYGAGVVWTLGVGGGTPAALASFNPSTAGSPVGPLLMDAHGDIFGTASSGGTGGNGAAWELASGSSTITILGAFNGSNGGQPLGGMVMDSKGDLFGTAYIGGANGDGTIWEIKAGTTTIVTLATFNGTNGLNLYGGVAMDANGNLYGTTYSGTLWELGAGSSTITTLATFGGAVGSTPSGGVTMDANGDLYGTATYSGAGDAGTVWELAAGSNTITALASFNFTDGGNPMGGVTIGPNGNLYGTSSNYGADGYGTVWELQGAAAVPEPSSIVLGSIGLAFAGAALTAGNGRRR